MNYLFSAATNLMENANLIIPNTKTNGSLWLGNYKAILDLNFLTENNVSVVINCTPDIPYIYEVYDTSQLTGLTQLETFRIPVRDSLKPHDIYLMEEYYHIALPFVLQKLIKESKNVIINCYAGKQRSASLLALVLYVLIENNILTDYVDLPLKTSDKSEQMRNIIQFVLKKRPQAFTFGFRINFKESLEKFLNITF